MVLWNIWQSRFQRCFFIDLLPNATWQWRGGAGVVSDCLRNSPYGAATIAMAVKITPAGTLSEFLRWMPTGATGCPNVIQAYYLSPPFLFLSFVKTSLGWPYHREAAYFLNFCADNSILFLVHDGLRCLIMWRKTEHSNINSALLSWSVTYAWFRPKNHPCARYGALYNKLVVVTTPL